MPQSHIAMEADGRSGITLEILEVLKEINAKLNDKQQIVSRMKKEPETVHAVTAQSDVIKTEEDASVHLNEKIRPSNMGSRYRL